MDIPPNPSDVNPSRIDGDDDRVDRDLSATSLGNSHSLAESYRRPSFFTRGARGTVVPYPQAQEHAVLADWEREQILEEERDLLADSHVIHPEHRHAKATKGRSQITGLLSKRLKESETFPREEDEESAQLPGSSSGPDSSATETTALLASSTALGNHVSDNVSDDEVGSKWEEAVEAGLIHTTWRREAKVLSKYTVPLMITFILQYSLTVASIFTVGHLGKVELGAVSLAIWFFAERILMVIVPEKDVAVLTGLYLKIVLLGAPGYACFESGKRFVQAQGLFSAGLVVLVICAPLNAFLNWLFVWKLGFGFVGAPMAVAISDNLLHILLFLYVRFIAGL
ncbi:conserved hypothetical protein [Histoplasma mississippiense (nom. inval.)]|uniref:conserved hypothetical protein n=1 Tax=Ajellomyces capsulatus (strain NAm1 / WU24) TaxID=2059318 RepID=UPI000157B3C7|nr:conserved hypothetical protein [Histoplasma mississippiense (nom. inval.)]EDN03210.1 conserved hypothetical protein [Histoplasma mississippiense (nom. inval.)]